MSFLQVCCCILDNFYFGGINVAAGCPLPGTMKVAIRLALHGCANRPFYHIVAMPHRRSRNGRVLEQIGSFDPLPNVDNETLVAINFERLRFWLTSGAEPTVPVQILLGESGGMHSV